MTTGIECGINKAISFGQKHILAICIISIESHTQKDLATVWTWSGIFLFNQWSDDTLHKFS